MGRQDEAAVAVAALDEVVLAHLQIDQGVAEDAAAVAGDALGRDHDLFGRGDDSVGMAGRHGVRSSLERLAPFLEGPDL
ncbi:hypothetical protein D3C71_1975260 [compost metagenome]